MSIQTRGLALDLGATTGWACDDPNGSSVPLAGIWDCSHQEDNLGEAFGELEYQIILAVRRLKPAYIAYEAAITPMWGKTNSATSRALWGFGAIVELTAWRLDVLCFDVNLITARKYFTGNGRSTKSDIWHQCKLSGWPAQDLNSCDAICVLAYSRACFGIHQLLGRTLDRSA